MCRGSALAPIALTIAVAGCGAKTGLLVPDVICSTADAGFCPLGRAVPGAIVPDGFCVREFVESALLPEPRTLAFAPNGDLFVGAPSMTTPGGNANTGPGALLVVSDDDRDGVGEVHTYLSGVPDIHGIAIAPDAIYFTTRSAVMSTPYASGQRSATTTSVVASVPAPLYARWTHGLARSPAGALYVTSGTVAATCPDSASGSIQQVMADGALATIATGFRNPMYARCHFADEVCAATELGDDGGGMWDAREKLVLLRPATNYGYPCCNGLDAPNDEPSMSCATVTMEDARFTLTETPFGLDWERGIWSDPQYRNAVFVAKHGSFYSYPAWQGEGIFAAPTDPVTHAPNGPFTPFVTGFEPIGAPWRQPDAAPPGPLRRPSDVAFAPDGRLFFADDFGGGIYWVAPGGIGCSTR